MQRSIPTLTSWRGIMAVLVMLFHYNVHSSGFNPLAQLAVCFFFVSSGFLLAMKYRFTRLDRRGWWAFVRPRVSFLFPVHWLVMALFLLFVAFDPFQAVWSSLPYHFLLLHGWLPGYEMHFSWNGASWFLGALVFCYVCYPVLRHYYSALRLSRQWLIVLAVMAGWWLVLPRMTAGMREYAYVLPVVRLGDFVLGMALAPLALRLGAKVSSLSRAGINLVEAFSIGFPMMVVAICLTTDWLRPWEDFVLWWLPMAFLVMVAWCLDGHEGILGRCLKARPLVWLGTISFEIYMLHLVVPKFTNYLVAPVFGHYGIMVYGKMLWFNVALVILASWAFHRWATVPLRRKIRKSSLPS